jgi:hypothetical protein
MLKNGIFFVGVYFSFGDRETWKWNLSEIWKWGFFFLFVVQA